MKLKLDENLPESLVSALSALGHDVDNVRLEGLVGQSDPKVWRVAQQEGRFFITQDLDFSDVRQFKPGAHHGLLLVRLRLPGRRALAARITEAFRAAETTSWSRCFILLTDSKLRIHRASE